MTHATPWPKVYPPAHAKALLLLALPLSLSALSACNLDAKDQRAKDNKHIVLRWEIPRARLNGDAMLINELGGYEVRYMNVSTELRRTEVVRDPYATETALKGLSTGEWQFSIAAFDIYGLYSPFTPPLTLWVD